jgi:hypothetical protein
VPRAVPVLLCLLTLALAACGGGDDEREPTALLSRSEAQRLDERVSRIGQLAAEGRCEAARDNLRDFAFRVEQLPERRDPDVRRELEDGAGELERTLERECAPEEAPETTGSTTTEPEVETAPETTEEVAPPPTTTEEIEPAPVDPTPTPVPDEDGEGGAGDEGTPPGQGGTPPGQGGTPPGQLPDDSGGVQAPGGDG